MSLTSKNITLGSGHLYIQVDSGTTPTEAALAVEANRLGHVVNGAELDYEVEIYKATDDLGLVSKVTLTEENVIFKAGIMTYDGATLAKLISTATYQAGTSSAPDVVLAGGINNLDLKDYWLLFVSQDEEHKILMKGNFTSSFNLGFKKDEQTIIDTEFTCKPLDSDGHLFKYSLDV